MAWNPLPDLSKLDIEIILNQDQEYLYGPPRLPVMFQSTDADQWQPTDVNQWLENLCSTYNKDTSYLHKFKNILGCQLLKMSLEEFISRDPINGSFFYSELLKHQEGNSCRGTLSPSNTPSPYDDAYFSPGSPRTYITLKSSSVASATSKDSWNNESYDINSSDTFPLNDIPVTSDGTDQLFMCPHNLDDIHISEDDFSDVLEECSMGSPVPMSPYQTSWNGYTTETLTSSSYPESVTSSSYPESMMSSHYPDTVVSSHYPDTAVSSSYSDTPVSSPYPNTCTLMSNSYPDTSVSCTYTCASLYSQQEYEGSPPSCKGTKQQRRGRGERGPKLFEFLFSLLSNPDYNPSIIRWECKDDLCFRLVDQHQMAKLWGERRNRAKTTDLSYEHFARAMRYYYKTGRLISVPEKKLVYRFGGEIFNKLAG